LTSQEPHAIFRAFLQPENHRIAIVIERHRGMAERIADADLNRLRESGPAII
jgi:hypothetical protein